MSELVDRAFAIEAMKPSLVVQLCVAERAVEKREKRITELEEALRKACHYCRTNHRRIHFKDRVIHRVDDNEYPCLAPAI